MAERKAAAKTGGRYVVRVTNHQSGEVWAIHDSRDTCDTELASKLSDWGKKNCSVDGPIQLTEE